LPDLFQFGIDTPASRTPFQVRGDSIPLFPADFAVLVRGKPFLDAMAPHLAHLFLSLFILG
jgi:hypothetical protein